MYHHVGPAVLGTNPDLTVTPAQFERQLRWLKSRGYTSILPTDWLNYVSHGNALPKRPLLLTFDDAYADLAECCFPLLEKYGFTAVVFVPTANIGGTNTWDQPIWPEPHRVLSAEQILHWVGRGIEFGAHSRTHPDLTKLSVAECMAEIVGSKNDLVALLGLPIVSFAYPYGENNEASRDFVREEFGLGFGTEEGMNNLRTDRHLLRRIYIGPNDSLVEFALFMRLDGAKRVRDHLSKFRVRTRLKSAIRWISRTFSQREQSTSG
jgi:peptidoglycan/xylan/chitin deacetylase (PgdA/CDA1 family)